MDEHMVYKEISIYFELLTLITILNVLIDPNQIKRTIKI